MMMTRLPARQRHAAARAAPARHAGAQKSVSSMPPQYFLAATQKHAEVHDVCRCRRRVYELRREIPPMSRHAAVYAFIESIPARHDHAHCFHYRHSRHRRHIHEYACPLPAASRSLSPGQPATMPPPSAPHARPQSPEYAAPHRTAPSCPPCIQTSRRNTGDSRRE